MGHMEEGRLAYAEAIAINRRCGRDDIKNICHNADDEEVCHMILSLSLIPELAPVA